MNKKEAELLNKATGMLMKGKLDNKEFAVLVTCMSELSFDKYLDIPTTPLLEIYEDVFKASRAIDSLVNLELIDKKYNGHGGYRLISVNDDKPISFSWDTFMNGNIALQFKDQLSYMLFIRICDQRGLQWQNMFGELYVDDPEYPTDKDKIIPLAAAYRIEREDSELDSIDCVLFDDDNKHLYELNLEEVNEGSIPVVKLSMDDFNISGTFKYDDTSIKFHR